MNRPLNLSLEDKLNKPLLENSAGNQYQRHMIDVLSQVPWLKIKNLQ